MEIQRKFQGRVDRIIFIFRPVAVLCRSLREELSAPRIMLVDFLFRAHAPFFLSLLRFFFFRSPNNHKYNDIIVIVVRARGQLHYMENMEDWRAGPMGLASAQQAYLRSRRSALGQVSPDDMTVPPLPEGWKEELDEVTAVHYYVNDETGERSWVRPNFRPPGPGGGPMMGGTCIRVLLITLRMGFAFWVFVVYSFSHRKFYY